MDQLEQLGCTRFHTQIPKVIFDEEAIQRIQEMKAERKPLWKRNNPSPKIRLEGKTQGGEEEGPENGDEAPTAKVGDLVDGLQENQPEHLTAAQASSFRPNFELEIWTAPGDVVEAHAWGDGQGEE